MPEKKSRFVLVCRQVLAVGTVAALAAPALGVASLDIVSPTPQPGGDRTQAASAPVALVAAEPVEPEVTEVPLDGVDEQGLQALTDRPAAQRKAASDLAVLSEPEVVEGYATVGVTWDQGERIDDENITVEVRSKVGEDWGPWEEIEYHDEHGPDPDSAEGRRARQGTEPIVVGDVDEVQVKVQTADGEAPKAAELVVVDPKDTPAPRLEAPAIDTADLPDEGAAALSSATTSTTTGTTTEEPAPTPDGEVVEVVEGDPTVDGDPTVGEDPDGVLTASTSVTPKPQIFSRAQWGADESLRSKSSLKYFEVHAGFVHHTVNSNNYTRAQVPSLLRGIYAYHTKGRGWSDIGYNFIVDKFGRIWEGRYGGVDRPVVGAHTMGYNEYSFAMSALGNFDTAQPWKAMVNAYGRLFAWKLALHGVSASDTSQKVGSKYFPAINGHRDAGSTACPGRYLYAKLGQIRSIAAAHQKPFSSRTRSTNLAGSTWPDILLRDARTKAVRVLRTGGQSNFYSPAVGATGWKGMDAVTAGGDFNGDGVADVVARNASTRVTAVYRGTSSGRLSTPVGRTKQFRAMTIMVATPDMTGDGKPDMIAGIKEVGVLWLFPGNGRGGFRPRRVLSRAWSGFDLTAAAGDLNGDRRNDIVARKSGRLYLFPGNGRTIGSPKLLPGQWGQFQLIAGGGDLTMDGKDDLIAKARRSRQTFIFPGTRTSRFGGTLGPFGHFRASNVLSIAGQMVGTSAADVVARDGGGRLLTYRHNGARNVEAVQNTGRVITDTNILLNVGDWNGDGRGDMVTRSRAGVLFLWRGNGSGGFSERVRMGTGWQNIQLLAAVGDITGDGYPDLMGQPKGSAMRIYPGNGATGFQASYVAHSAISSDVHSGLGLWDADGSPDTLMRRPDGSLMVYRGNGPGGLTSPTRAATGGGRFDWLESIGDANGDRRPDLVGRDRNNKALYLLLGTANGGFARPQLLAAGFSGYDLTS